MGGAREPPLFSDQTETRRAEKEFFLRPPPLRSRSATAFLIFLNDTTYVLLSVLNLTAMIFPRKIRNLSDSFDGRFDCSEDGSI